MGGASGLHRAGVGGRDVNTTSARMPRRLEGKTDFKQSPQRQQIINYSCAKAGKAVQHVGTSCNRRRSNRQSF